MVQLVLLPKGNGKFRGIGFLEIVWKLLEVIIHRRLATKILFHESLHGIRAKRGTTTAILKVKTMQEAVQVDQSTFHGIFLDLRKAYDQVYR